MTEKDALFACNKIELTKWNILAYIVDIIRMAPFLRVLSKNIILKINVKKPKCIVLNKIEIYL